VVEDVLQGAVVREAGKQCLDCLFGVHRALGKGRKTATTPKMQLGSWSAPCSDRSGVYCATNTGRLALQAGLARQAILGDLLDRARAIRVRTDSLRGDPIR
jgi:hypothetical protein